MQNFKFPRTFTAFRHIKIEHKIVIHLAWFGLVLLFTAMRLHSVVAFFYFLSPLIYWCRFQRTLLVFLLHYFVTYSCRHFIYMGIEWMRAQAVGSQSYFCCRALKCQMNLMTHKNAHIEHRFLYYSLFNWLDSSYFFFKKKWFSPDSDAPPAEVRNMHFVVVVFSLRFGSSTTSEFLQCFAKVISLCLAYIDLWLINTSHTMWTARWLRAVKSKVCTHTCDSNVTHQLKKFRREGKMEIMKCIVNSHRVACSAVDVSKIVLGKLISWSKMIFARWFSR